MYIQIMKEMLRQAVKRPLTSILARCERAALARTPDCRYPPIFLLGVPRSGTTLLYQLLIHCFELSYFCNVAERHSRYAATMTSLFRSLIRRARIDFENDYGHTPGLRGPSEGLDIWHRWFPDGYVDHTHLTPRARIELRRTIAAIQAAVGAPFLNKDPHHCVRIRALNVAFPRCIYVYIHRDPAANAASLLNMRLRRAARGQGCLSTWISVKPKEYVGLAQSDPITQVCGQVHYCARNALEDLRALPRERYVIVSYERMCADPEGSVASICSLARANGIRLDQRKSTPDRFRQPEPVAISDADRELIRTRLAQFGDQTPLPTICK